jgi:hypothetical protein
MPDRAGYAQQAFAAARGLETGPKFSERYGRVFQMFKVWQTACRADLPGMPVWLRKQFR